MIEHLYIKTRNSLFFKSSVRLSRNFYILLLKAGRLNYEGTGLVLLIVLGLATFLDGYRLNLFFSLVGVFIFALAMIAAYIEEYLWGLLIVMFILGVIVFFWERHKLKEALNSP